MSHVFFATSVQHPSLTDDDLLAAAALRERGVAVTPLIWTEANPTELTGTSAIVIRSCWDYHVQPQAFLGWLADLARAGVPTINSVPLLQWNLHKRYLLDLAALGAPVVPTILVEPSSGPVQLEQLLATAGWREAVIKPAISLSAHETWRVEIENAEEHQERFSRLQLLGDVLVQHYLREVSVGGEWSLVFFHGEYSHAVLKMPARGDFRVQQEHGGRANSASPPQRLIQQARDILGLLPETPLYARVDGIEVNAGFVLMEVECIDPVLFLGQQPKAVGVFADAIARQIGAPIAPTPQPGTSAFQGEDGTV